MGLENVVVDNKENWLVENLNHALTEGGAVASIKSWIRVQMGTEESHNREFLLVKSGN